MRSDGVNHNCSDTDLVIIGDSTSSNNQMILSATTILLANTIIATDAVDNLLSTATIKDVTATTLFTPWQVNLDKGIKQINADGSVIQNFSLNNYGPNDIYIDRPSFSGALTSNSSTSGDTDQAYKINANYGGRSFSLTSASNNLTSVTVHYGSNASSTTEFSKTFTF